MERDVFLNDLAKWGKWMEKRIGPTVEPEGCLQDMEAEDEQDFPVELQSFVLDKYEGNWSKECFSWWIRIMWSALSRATVRNKNKRTQEKIICTILGRIWFWGKLKTDWIFFSRCSQTKRLSLETKEEYISTAHNCKIVSIVKNVSQWRTTVCLPPQSTHCQL